MNNKIINEASKMFEELTIHLHSCNEYDCCVRALAQELIIDDKMVDVSGPHQAKEVSEISKQGDRYD
jgi:hypothetical protein